MVCDGNRSSHSHKNDKNQVKGPAGPARSPPRYAKRIGDKRCGTSPGDVLPSFAEGRYPDESLFSVADDRLSAAWRGFGLREGDAGSAGMPDGPIPGVKGSSRWRSSRYCPGRRLSRSGPACGNGRRKRDGRSSESLSFCRNLVVDKVHDSSDNNDAGLNESQWSPFGGRKPFGAPLLFVPFLRHVFQHYAVTHSDEEHQVGSGAGYAG